MFNLVRTGLVLVLVMLALPAGAEECIAGRPSQLRYDDGHTITIIQRHGSDVTFTQPYEGGTDAVQKSHLMLFPKTARFGARGIEYRWTSRLPKLDDLQPGTRFDLLGTMRSGKEAEIDYRAEGDVAHQVLIEPLVQAPLRHCAALRQPLAA